IPAEFFPWSFLLPGAVWLGWKRLEGRDRKGFLFALAWMVVTVVFFSLSPAKRSVYILTMYPAMALLVGAFLDRIAADTADTIEWPQGRRWVVWPVWLIALLALLIEIALPVAGRGRAE